MPQRAKLFLDTEFTGLHQSTTLISLGIIAEDNSSFYVEFTDYDTTQIDNWLETNVLQKLTLKAHPEYYEAQPQNTQWELKGPQIWVLPKLRQFLNRFPAIEIWADNPAYDWVLFCQLFGHALNIPSHICYIPFDLSTLVWAKGIDPDISREAFIADQISNIDSANKHNALWDAQVLKCCFEKASKM